MDTDAFRRESRAAYWRGFHKGMVKGAIFCALVGLLAWPWLVKVA